MAGGKPSIPRNKNRLPKFTRKNEIIIRQRTFGAKSEANLLPQLLFDEIGVADQTTLEPDTKTITDTCVKKGQSHRV